MRKRNALPSTHVIAFRALTADREFRRMPHPANPRPRRERCGHGDNPIDCSYCRIARDLVFENLVIRQARQYTIQNGHELGTSNVGSDATMYSHAEGQMSIRKTIE